MKKNKKIIAFLLIISMFFCFCACFKTTDLDKICKNKNEYKLSLTYNETEHTLSGEQIVRYVNNTGKVLTNACFHLYANNFSKGAVNKPVSENNISKAYPNGFSEGHIEIKKVLVNNKNANFELTGDDENILDVKFNVALQPTALHEIYIKFVVAVPNVLHRLGYTDNSVNLANFYPVACVYENNNFVTDAYNSNGDPFYSDIAKYDVEIKYPLNYEIACTGVKKISSDNNNKICKSSAKAVRDFAIVLSKNFKVVSEEIDGINVNYFYYSDKKPEESLKTCVNSIETFNNLFGKYPYESLDVVETGFLHGGMEYPNLVMISDKLDSYEDYTYVIVHEIAHQWWYGLVGNNQYQYGWLDEGLAEYSCMLFYENNSEYGKDYQTLIQNALNNYQLFLDVYREVYGKVETTMNRKLNEFPTEPEYSYTAYTKAMLMQDALRNVLGTKTYLKCLRDYFEQYKFLTVTPENLVSAFSESCNKDLTSFFNAWINGEVVFSA